MKVKGRIEFEIVEELLQFWSVPAEESHSTFDFTTSFGLDFFRFFTSKRNKTFSFSEIFFFLVVFPQKIIMDFFFRFVVDFYLIWDPKSNQGGIQRAIF